jgi:cytochrome b pre-mRNA-processing protein 3
MGLTRLFRPNPQREAAYRLYGAIVAAARNPWFFAACGVPDTLDGRFDLIALHATLVFRRLNREHDVTKEFAQEVFDAMFADLDRALREMGTGDLGVGKQVKRMASGFYGRAKAYEQALADDDTGLEAALRRNVFGTAEPGSAELTALARHVRRTVAALDGEATRSLVSGTAGFPAPGA